MPTSSTKSISCFISGSTRVVENPFEIDTSDSYYNDAGNPIGLTNLDPTSDVGNEYIWKTTNIVNYYNQAVQGVLSTSPSGYTALIDNGKNQFVYQETYLNYYYGDYENKVGFITRCKPVGPSGYAEGGWLFCLHNGETRLYRKSNDTDIEADWNVLEASGVSLIQQINGVSQYGYCNGDYKAVVSGEYLQFYYDPYGTNQLLIEHKSTRYLSDEYTGHGLYCNESKLNDTQFSIGNDIIIGPYKMYSAKNTEYWTQGPQEERPLYIDGIGADASGIDLYIRGTPQGYCQYTPHLWDIYTSDNFDRGEELTDLGQTNLVPTMNVGTVKDWKSTNMNISGGGYYITQRTQDLSTPNPTGHVAFIQGNGNYDYQDVSIYLNPYYYNYYEGTLNGTGTNNRAGVILRVNASGEYGHSRNGMLFCIDNGIAKLYKRDNDDDFNAPFNTLVDSGQEIMNEYDRAYGAYIYGTLRAVASGEYIKGYWNDNLVLEHIDETLYRSPENDDMGFYIDDRYLYLDGYYYHSIAIDEFKCSSANAESYIYCSNSGIPLYTHSLPDYGSGQFPLYIISKGTASQARTLYIKNAMAGSGQIPLYTIAHIPSNTGMPLYAISIGDASGEMPLYMVGHIPSNTGIPLYIEGMIRSSGSMPLYTINNPERSNITLYIHYLQEPHNSTIPLYLYNSSENKGIDLVVWGRGTPNSINDAVPSESTIALFIEGLGVYKNVPLYTICGTGEQNAELPFYINSVEFGSGQIPLFIDSYASQTKPLKLYSHGY